MARREGPNPSRIVLNTLERLCEVIAARLPDIADVIVSNAGKVRPDAEAEVYDVIDAFDYFFEKLNDVQVVESIAINSDAMPNSEVRYRFVPFGVVALIMPWNFPFYVLMMPLMPALLAGNAVLVKPSELSTKVGLKLEELLIEAGMPDGLIHILPGADETGRAVAKSGVDKIFFTGSIEACRDIIANAGLTPVQAELGGNSAAIVLADSDLDLAAKAIAFAGTYHSGQDCVGIKRVFLHESIADELESKLQNILEGLRPDIDYGPYITRDARAEVKRRINSAIAGGARLVCGGEIDPADPGNWMTPALLVDIRSEMELVATETFGNVLPIQRFSQLDQAIELANATHYGLSNAVFTGNAELAQTIADRLQSGMVFVNDAFMNFPGWDHWTGWKQSNCGSHESKIMQFVKKKVVGTNHGAKPREWWYPY